MNSYDKKTSRRSKYDKIELSESLKYLSKHKKIKSTTNNMYGDNVSCMTV